MATTKDYGIGGFTFPRGWFVAAEASEATKTPTALRYFGRDLIMYRGASGQVIVMDAYCPHMKTHLARNTTSYVVLDDEHVQGDDIVCPYHAWKFGPDGICKEIPYSPAPIPKDARIRTYPAREWGGLVLVWYDEEALEPNFEPPALPEWDDETWMNWTIDDLGEIDCHGQEVIDNIVDKAHLPPIHGSTNFQYFESEFKDHIAIQRLSAGHKTLSADILTNDTWYTGPGILLSRMEGDYSSIMLLAHTSVEDGRVKCWHGLLVKPQAILHQQKIWARLRRISRLRLLRFLRISRSGKIRRLACSRCRLWVTVPLAKHEPGINNFIIRATRLKNIRRR